MSAMLNSLNAHNFLIFQSILMTLVSKFMVYRALSDKTYLLIGLRSPLNKIQASYTLEGTVLENVDNIKYLGVTITNDLKWNTHISNICTKANRTLGFLRRTLFSCPQNVKEAAYKGMLRPILEYGISVWDPHPDKLQKELEKVQNRAARFVTRNYVYETGSMTGILGQLKWESLKKRRKDNRLILLYKVGLGIPVYRGIPRYFFGGVRTTAHLPVPRYSGVSIFSNRKH